MANAEIDSGRGNIVSASASKINGTDAPWKRPASAVDNPIERGVDGRIGFL